MDTNPNHWKKAIAYFLISQVLHTGKSMAITKNGNQQATKAPVMIANVLAAFLSFFDSFGIFFLLDRVGPGDVSIVEGSGPKSL